MVLTGAQTTAFFEEAEQMGLPHGTVVQLAVEGIATVYDLADFDKESLKAVADNLRRPAGRVQDPDPGADPGATIPTPPFVFGAKSHRRLLVATDLIKYYNEVGRVITPANIAWNHVMKNFEIQWKALKERQSDDPPDTPKITRALPVLRWTEAFKDFLSRVIGVRTIPLSYVIREEATPPAAIPALANDQPHSAEHKSVEGELVARASHTHPLYRDDNATVYHYLEEATRSTAFAASIKPFQRAKDGRGAWKAIKSQYAGDDKWEAEIKRQEKVLHTHVWKGQSNYSLEHFVSQHRNAFVSLEACAEHVNFQLPNGHSRVGYLLQGIHCSDAELQAAMASIKADKADDGMRNNFEAAAAHLLPADPVARKRAAIGTKRGSAQISDTTALDTVADIGATQAKPSIGNTGVHLRYYKASEYKKLSEEQKAELREWRHNNPDAHKSKRNGKPTRPSPTKRAKFDKKQISSIVAKEVASVLEKQKTEEAEQDANEAYIMSLVQKAVGKNDTASASSTAAKLSLNSILKNAKNATGKK